MSQPQSHYNGTEYESTDNNRQIRELIDYCPKCGEDTPHEYIVNTQTGETESNCKWCDEMGVV